MFSKILFPGCRLGFIAAGPELIEQLVAFRSIVNHKSNVLVQAAVGQWMREGGLERHLRKTTKIYHQRQQFMSGLVNLAINDGLIEHYDIPNGGMAFWLKLSGNANIIEEKAKQAGIYIQTEKHFHLHQHNNKNQYMRLGFAGQNENGISDGFSKLLNIIESTNH